MLHTYVFKPSQFWKKLKTFFELHNYAFIQPKFYLKNY